MTHLPVTQSSILALIAQIAAFVAGFGVVNSIQEGVIITVTTAVVNAAFLISNALHHQAHAKVVAAGATGPVVSLAVPQVPVPPVT